MLSDSNRFPYLRSAELFCFIFCKDDEIKRHHQLWKLTLLNRFGAGREKMDVKCQMENSAFLTVDKSSWYEKPGIDPQRILLKKWAFVCALRTLAVNSWMTSQWLCESQQQRNGWDAIVARSPQRNNKTTLHKGLPLIKHSLMPFQLFTPQRH